jgi:hypothetical protein
MVVAIGILEWPQGHSNTCHRRVASNWFGQQECTVHYFVAKEGLEAIQIHVIGKSPPIILDSEDVQFSPLLLSLTTLWQDKGVDSS